MNKLMKTFCAASAMALAMAATPAVANDSYKEATQEEMTVPDRNGYIVLHRQGRRVVGCTADNHLFLAYFFATAHHTSVRNLQQPAPVDQYLRSLDTAMKAGLRRVNASDFDQRQWPRGIPQSVLNRLEENSEKFSKTNGYFISWLHKGYSVTARPAKACMDAFPR